MFGDLIETLATHLIDSGELGETWLRGDHGLICKQSLAVVKNSGASGFTEPLGNGLANNLPSRWWWRQRFEAAEFGAFGFEQAAEFAEFLD